MSDAAAPGGLPAARAIDVSHLPTHAFGTRDTHWWGTVLLMLIEGVMMALLFVSYFYLRKNYDVWPPQRLGDASRIAGAFTTAIALASVVPAVRGARAARRESLRGMQRSIGLAALLSLLTLVPRALELAWISVRWDTHAYGSVVWVILGMHTVHLGAGVMENLVLAALLFREPLEKKHFCDAHVTMIFWLFAVAEQVPIFAVLYFDPVLFAH